MNVIEFKNKKSSTWLDLISTLKELKKSSPTINSFAIFIDDDTETNAQWRYYGYIPDILAQIEFFKQELIEEYFYVSEYE